MENGRRRIWSVLFLLVALMLPWDQGTGRSASNEAWGGEPQSLERPADGHEGTIVAFGDSLTEGFRLDEKESYPAQLQKKLLAGGYNYRVVNAGISGETSSGALSRVNWILSLKPHIVILETGANDGFRGIKPELIQQNMEQIVRALKDHGVVVILAGMEMLRNLGEEYVVAFREVYSTVARKEDLILIPFFLHGVAGKADLNLPDGIHPTAEGYRIVTDTVYPYVVKAIERRRQTGN